MKQEIDDVAVYSAFKKHLRTVAPVSDDLWILMTRAMRISAIKKGELLLEEGAVCKHIYYIYKGSFRFLYLKANEEVTTALYTEDVCMTNMKSLATSEPSNVFIQSLEDGIIVKVSKETLTQLHKEAPALEAVTRLIMERKLADDTEWREIYTIYSPEERYRFLLTKAPEIVQKVPLQYIASLLGVRRETLSRIRSRSSRTSL